jgi:predicted Holliday junction resolvase-like endonuclease
MIWVIAILFCLGVASSVQSVYLASQVKELKTKLESQRQKREIDEAKRIELKQQLWNATQEAETQKAAVARLDHQVHDPRAALALLTRIIEAEHPDD